MPYEIAWSKSEFSVGGSLSNYNIAFVKEHSEETGNYTVSLTLYDDGTHTASLNLDGSASVETEIDDYTSVEYSVQAFLDDDGEGSDPPWAPQPQEESAWDVLVEGIQNVLVENRESLIIGGAIIAGGCVAMSIISRTTPHKATTVANV